MFREALVSQCRVILALMLREARTRYGRQKAGYLWALVEPIVFILGFSYLFYLVGRQNPFGGSPAVFLTTGMVNFFGFRNVMNRTEGGYGSNTALLSFPVVKVLDVFLSRALLEFATWVLVIIILLGALIATGYGSLPANLELMVAALLGLFGIALGLGVIIGLIAQFFPALGSLMKIPNRLLFLSSGVFFLPDNLPPGVRDVVAWNPVLQGITLFRVGYYHLYESQVLDIPYLFSWAIGALLFGLIAERMSRKSVLAMY